MIEDKAKRVGSASDSSVSSSGKTPKKEVQPTRRDGIFETRMLDWSDPHGTTNIRCEDGSYVAVPLEVRKAEPTNTLQRDGKTWLVTFEGTTKGVPDSTGMRYIAILVQYQGKEFRPADLLACLANPDPIDPRVHRDALGEGMVRVRGGDSAENIVDPEYIKKLGMRYRELEREIDEAEDRGDAPTSERLEDERLKIGRELNRVSDRLGKPRKTGDREKRRKAVSMAIHRALKMIESAHGPLHAHLRSFLSTQTPLSYRPNPPIAWTVDS